MINEGLPSKKKIKHAIPDSHMAKLKGQIWKSTFLILFTLYVCSNPSADVNTHIVLFGTDHPAVDWIFHYLSFVVAFCLQSAYRLYVFKKESETN